MARGETPFSFGSEDLVIFSSNTIPVPSNIQRRKHLETQLAGLGTRLFVDIHVSGHAAREDLRDLLLMTKPKELIPTHGDKPQKMAFATLAEELGYSKSSIHILHNGKSLKLG